MQLLGLTSEEQSHKAPVIYLAGRKCPPCSFQLEEVTLARSCTRGPLQSQPITAVLPNASVGSQEGEGIKFNVQHLQMCSQSSAGPMGSPAHPALGREAWSPFHPL